MKISQCDRCKRRDDTNLGLKMMGISYWLYCGGARPTEVANDLCSDCVEVLCKFVRGEATPSVSDQAFEKPPLA